MFTLHDRVIPVFLEMPQNAFVFENVAPILYQSMHRHLLHIGYKLVDEQSMGYTVKFKILKLQPITKFVSSQLNLLHQQMTLDVECSLLNFKGQEVAKKSFSYSRLLSKARDPGMTNSFEDYVYTQLCQHLVVRIEAFLRPYLFDAFDKN